MPSQEATDSIQNNTKMLIGRSVVIAHLEGYQCLDGFGEESPSPTVHIRLTCSELTADRLELRVGTGVRNFKVVR